MGDGSPKREVIYVDDIADACVFFMTKRTKETVINIGTGKDYKIKKYVDIIAKQIFQMANLKLNLIKKNLMELPEKY